MYRGEINVWGVGLALIRWALAHWVNWNWLNMLVWAAGGVWPRPHAEWRRFMCNVCRGVPEAESDATCVLSAAVDGNYRFLSFTFM